MDESRARSVRFNMPLAIFTRSAVRASLARWSHGFLHRLYALVISCTWCGRAGREFSFIRIKDNAVACRGGCLRVISHVISGKHLRCGIDDRHPCYSASVKKNVRFAARSNVEPAAHRTSPPRSDSHRKSRIRLRPILMTRPRVVAGDVSAVRAGQWGQAATQSIRAIALVVSAEPDLLVIHA